MINIQDQFSVNIGLPIDKRIVANGSAGRNAITYKYDGLLVFDTSDRRTYVWNSANNAWGAADVSGAGQTNYLSKWSSSTGLTFSNIFITNVTNNYLAKVGINTNGTTVQEVFQVNSANTSSPPFVIHKGASNNIIGSNWYNNGTDQYFDSSVGSGIIKFRSNGEIWFGQRINGSANPPIASSDTISDDYTLLLYPGTINTGSVKITKNTNFNWDGTSGSAALIRANNAYSTPTTPDYTWWYNDQNGFYHPASNTIGVSIAGVQRAIFGANGLLLSAASNITVPQRNLHIDSNTGNATIIQLTNGTTSGTGNNSGFHIALNSAAYPYFATRTNDNPFLFVFSNGNSRHRLNSNQYIMYSNSNGENFNTITSANGGGGSRVVRGTKLVTWVTNGTYTVDTLLVPSNSQVSIEATFVTSIDSPRQFVSKKLFAQYTVNSGGVVTAQNTGGAAATGVVLSTVSSSSSANIGNSGNFVYSSLNQISMQVGSATPTSGASVVSFTATINTVRGH